MSNATANLIMLDNLQNLLWVVGLVAVGVISWATTQNSDKNTVLKQVNHLFSGLEISIPESEIEKEKNYLLSLRSSSEVGKEFTRWEKKWERKERAKQRTSK